jgi:hypothetical protein
LHVKSLMSFPKLMALSKSDKNLKTISKWSSKKNSSKGPNKCSRPKSKDKKMSLKKLTMYFL